MITIPLEDGSPCLYFVSNSSIRPGWRIKLPAKIDTGAQFLMIPDRNKNFFTTRMTGNSVTFSSASSHSFLGREANILVNIQELGTFPLQAYYYPGERILFGVKELTKFFSFCLDRRNLYICPGDEKLPCD
ncbi:MAG: hypothetical protein GY749_01850 [Desulfobacteraceae bacterium]|nr:hypothetical protein [Desulfobacteraceae bacterium]